MNKTAIQASIAVLAMLAGTAAQAHGDHRKGDHWHGELQGAEYRSTGQANSNRTAPAGSVTLTQAAALPQTDGEIRRIDLEARKITLKHGEIRNLDMPPMTMSFVVKDSVALANFKVGDKVRFGAMKEGSSYVVTEMAPAP